MKPNMSTVTPPGQSFCRENIYSGALARETIHECLKRSLTIRWVGLDHHQRDMSWYQLMRCLFSMSSTNVDIQYI